MAPLLNDTTTDTVGTTLQNGSSEVRSKTDANMTRALQDDQAVLAVRNLAMDLCTQNGGGHGGSAIGMAAIGVALWKYAMRFNPADPEWFDRDRFVLSNGAFIRLFERKILLLTDL